MRTTKAWPVLGLLLIVGLLAGACGSSTSGGSTGAQGDTPSSTRPIQEVDGCEKGSTDPTDLTAGRAVARCSPGSPAPQKLAEPATIKFSTPARLEFMSPVLLADAMGEFAKENLTVEVITLPFPDAVPQLAQGQLDVAAGGIEGSLFNAGAQGLGVKLVMGNYFPADAGDYDTPQVGIWCKRDAFSDPANPNFTEVAKMKLGLPAGKGSSGFYWANEMLVRRAGPDASIAHADVQQLPAADMLTALKNGAIGCGMLLDPIWVDIKDDPAFVLAATQTPGEPLGGYYFGKNLLKERPEVGDAFVRAVIRTINTYFTGDYHQNDEVVQAISKAINQPVENIRRTPSLLMDWEVRRGTTDRIQDLFIEVGGLLPFDQPVPEDKLVDRSYYQGAVGQQ